MKSDAPQTFFSVNPAWFYAPYQESFIVAKGMVVPPHFIKVRDVSDPPFSEVFIDPIFGVRYDADRKPIEKFIANTVEK
jgi:hypothetical protein